MLDSLIQIWQIQTYIFLKIWPLGSISPHYISSTTLFHKMKHCKSKCVNKVQCERCNGVFVIWCVTWYNYLITWIIVERGKFSDHSALTYIMCTMWHCDIVSLCLTVKSRENSWKQMQLKKYNSWMLCMKIKIINTHIHVENIKLFSKCKPKIWKNIYCMLEMHFSEWMNYSTPKCQIHYGTSIPLH